MRELRVFGWGDASETRAQGREAADPGGWVRRTSRCRGVCSPGKRTPKVAARFATVPDQQKPYRRANTPLRVKELERGIATDLLRLSLWSSRLRRGRVVMNSIDRINTEMARGLQRRQHRRALPVGLLLRTTARATGFRVQVRSAIWHCQ